MTVFEKEAMITNATSMIAMLNRFWKHIAPLEFIASEEIPSSGSSRLRD